MKNAWAPESSVWFEVNGGRRILTTCTPDDLHAQAAGYLLTEGYIKAATEISATEIVDAPTPAAGVRVTVPDSGVVRVGKLHRHIRENGCGFNHYASCDRGALCQDRTLAVPYLETFRELFVTFAEPEVIGMSAIAGLLEPVKRSEPGGLHVLLAQSLHL